MPDKNKDKKKKLTFSQPGNINDTFSTSSDTSYSMQYDDSDNSTVYDNSNVYISDAAIIAMAGLVGALYGVVDCALLIGSAAVGGIIVSIGTGVSSAISGKAESNSLIGGIVFGAMAGTAVLALATALVGLLALITPILVLEAAYKNAAHASSNPHQGALPRIFDGFKKVSTSSDNARHVIQKQLNNPMLNRNKSNPQEVD